MTFEDLRRTVLETVNAGRIGTPVALRWHLFSSEQSDRLPGLLAGLALGEEVFATQAVRLACRASHANRQTSLLCQFPAGQTLLATSVCGCGPDRKLQLLVVGNHGIARLEDGPWDGALPAADPEAQARLSAAIEKSAAAGTFADW